MAVLQNLIHRLEVAGGMRPIRALVVVLVLVAMPLLYNWRAFKNMSTQEAMDSAQLARNLSQGKGYTTSFIRPFSIHLVRRNNQEKQGITRPGDEVPDYAQIRGAHPDIANPPVYPVLLAGLMKVLPFRFTIPAESRRWWSIDGKFARHQPDFLIALFNQVLLFAVVGLIYLLARRLFDPNLAWLTALLVLGTELLWRFSVSGLSTILLLLIFTGLTWLIVLLEEETREPKWGGSGLFVLSALCGALVGVGCLTRYAFGWLILPVLMFVLLFTGRKRVGLAVVCVAAFALLIAPWIVRNYTISGTPFGTASYTIVEGAPLWPEHQLQRALDPEYQKPFMVMARVVWYKLMINARQVVQGDLLKLGGSWVTAFFVVGLLIGLQKPALRRLRYFVLASLAVLFVAQALGRTQLWEDSPEINSENLLVLLVPAVLLYGVSLFTLLLDQIDFPYHQLRHGAVGLFAVLACLPMLFTFLPPRSFPISLPYYPPMLQEAGAWTRADDLTMSDMPWALAWYGQRQAVWQGGPASFPEINDYLKPIKELHLTTISLEKTDVRELPDWLLANQRSWGALMWQGWQQVLPDLMKGTGTSTNWPKNVNLQVRQTNGVPATFPLHYLHSGWPMQFLLTERPQLPRTP